jgi:hypothetical protein
MLGNFEDGKGLGLRENWKSPQQIEKEKAASEETWQKTNLFMTAYRLLVNKFAQINHKILRLT